jgi:protein-S-isoprenylcysteine O-methyltransferase Ste14
MPEKLMGLPRSNGEKAVTQPCAYPNDTHVVIRIVSLGTTRLVGGSMSDSPQTRDAVTTGLATRPPLLFLACLALGLILDYALPLLPGVPASMPQWILAAILILAGAAIFAASTRNFARADTPVPSTEPVRALVTTGIHGVSRNPIYVGMFLIYAGIGVAARSPWMLVLLLPLAVVMRTIVVAREEAYLERHFGAAYRDYKARVRRWL